MSCPSQLCPSEQPTTRFKKSRLTWSSQPPHLQYKSPNPQSLAYSPDGSACPLQEVAPVHLLKLHRRW